VTTLTGRSQRTVRLCRSADFKVLDSLEEVVRESNVLVSVVPPGVAEAMADQYAEMAHLSPAGAMYVDANSIGPELAASLAARIVSRRRGFVDASIHGQAGNLAGGATLYLSGVGAGEIAALFEGAMRVRVLGDEPGRASAMKMILAGLSKGMCALFLEVAALALRLGMLRDMNDEVARFYPGILSAAERMLPTYPRNAARRVVEMRQLEETCLSVGQEPCLFDAARRLLEEFTGVGFDCQSNPRWTLETIVEQLVSNQFLANGMPLRQPGKL
jgi:3-hydroxyisobutyrate dehydrogenase-like beta-hydroxyacid dehydrogenase